MNPTKRERRSFGSASKPDLPASTLTVADRTFAVSITGLWKTGGDTVKIIPQFAADSPRKRSPATLTYVKVRWGDRYYLVEEGSLAAFAEKFAGLFVEPDDAAGSNYLLWSKYLVKGNLEDR